MTHLDPDTSTLFQNVQRAQIMRDTAQDKLQILGDFKFSTWGLIWGNVALKGGSGRRKNSFDKSKTWSSFNIKPMLIRNYMR